MTTTPSNITGFQMGDYVADVVHGEVVAGKCIIPTTNAVIDTLDVTDLKVGGVSVTAGVSDIVGVTASAAELNLNDGSVAGTAVASKTLALGANKNVDTLAIADGGLKLGAAAGTAVTSTAAELNQLDASTAAVLAESAGAIMREAVATYDFALDGGAISAIPIGDALPDNALVLGGFVEVETTLTSATDAATVALSIVGANDIVNAVAISTGTPWDAGKQAIIPKFNTPESTSLKLTAANQVDVTIAVEAVTAGKFHVHLFYVMGHA